jgi:hypothetical protein
MQFRTTYDTADFEGYINNAIGEALDNFASVYLDDILLYSDCEEVHIRHVKWIMQWLREAGFYLKPEKYKFQKESVRYLGLIITNKGFFYGWGYSGNNTEMEPREKDKWWTVD